MSRAPNFFETREPSSFSVQSEAKTDLILKLTRQQLASVLATAGPPGSLYITYIFGNKESTEMSLPGARTFERTYSSVIRGVLVGETLTRAHYAKK